MGLFSKKSTVPHIAPNKDTSLEKSSISAYVQVLKGPRITEKASGHQAVGVYTFNITEYATKRDIVRAVQSLYKVTPRMVRVVRVPSKAKRSMRTGRVGVAKGGRKAYVYLKPGESITIA